MRNQGRDWITQTSGWPTCMIERFDYCSCLFVFHISKVGLFAMQLTGTCMIERFDYCSCLFVFHISKVGLFAMQLTGTCMIERFDYCSCLFVFYISKVGLFAMQLTGTGDIDWTILNSYNKETSRVHVLCLDS